MLVGGTRIKAQAFKFANEMKIEDLRLKSSDGQVFIFENKRGLFITL